MDDLKKTFGAYKINLLGEFEYLREQMETVMDMISLGYIHTQFDNMSKAIDKLESQPTDPKCINDKCYNNNQDIKNGCAMWPDGDRSGCRCYMGE